jgi:hypothetical protein
LEFSIENLLPEQYFELEAAIVVEIKAKIVAKFLRRIMYLF